MAVLYAQCSLIQQVNRAGGRKNKIVLTNNTMEQWNKTLLLLKPILKGDIYNMRREI